MIAFQLPQDLYDKLQKLSQLHFRSVSAELRVIVSSYIDLNNDNIGEKLDRKQEL